MKHTAKKVRKLFNGKVIAGFAGQLLMLLHYMKNSKVSFKNLMEIYSVLQLNLLKNGEAIECYESLKQCLLSWIKTFIAYFRDREVIEPDDGILAIGSGGNYALSRGQILEKLR